MISPIINSLIKSHQSKGEDLSRSASLASLRTKLCLVFWSRLASFLSLAPSPPSLAEDFASSLLWFLGEYSSKLLPRPPRPPADPAPSDPRSSAPFSESPPKKLGSEAPPPKAEPLPPAPPPPVPPGVPGLGMLLGDGIFFGGGMGLDLISLGDGISLGLGISPGAGISLGASISLGAGISFCYLNSANLSLANHALGTGFLLF